MKINGVQTQPLLVDLPSRRRLVRRTQSRQRRGDMHPPLVINLRGIAAKVTRVLELDFVIEGILRGNRLDGSSIPFITDADDMNGHRTSGGVIIFHHGEKPLFTDRLSQQLGIGNQGRRNTRTRRGSILRGHRQRLGVGPRFIVKQFRFILGHNPPTKPSGGIFRPPGGTSQPVRQNHQLLNGFPEFRCWIFRIKFF